GGVGFVVSGESAVEHDPAQSSFHDPSTRYGCEAFDVWVSGDDFDVDTEVGTVFDHGVFEPGVDPGFGDGRVGGFGVVEQVRADGVVADTGGGDDHGQQEAEGVGDDSPFTANDSLRRIDALGGRWNIGGGLHALGVHDARRRFLGAACAAASQSGQVVAETVEYPLAGPRGEVAVHGLVGREIVR